MRVISLVQRLGGGGRGAEARGGSTGSGAGGAGGSGGRVREGPWRSGAGVRHERAAQAGATGEASNVCRYI